MDSQVVEDFFNSLAALLYVLTVFAVVGVLASIAGVIWLVVWLIQHVYIS